MRRALNLALFLVFIPAAVAVAEEGIVWQSDLDAARKLASQTNRLVLVHFWDLGCAPCAKMDQEVFSKASTAQGIAPYYVPVKLCASQVPQIRDYFGIKAWPTDVVITPAGQVLDKSVGYRPADQYVQWLTHVAQQNRPAAAPSQPSAGYAQGTPPTGTSSATTSLASPYSNDKYMEYLRQRNQTPAAARANAQQATQPTTQVAAMPQVNPAPQALAVTPPNPTYTPNSPAAPPQQYVGTNAAAGTPASVRPQISPPIPTPSATTAVATSTARAPSLPSGWPPLAMDGQCPVTLVETRDWKLGDLHWPVNHQGRTYLCAGPNEQAKLLANPNAFIPANEGLDPVLSLDRQQSLPGKTNYGIIYHERTYLFAGEDTLAQFEKNPRRYAADVIQARR
jgi:thioredoxin-related protein/YHS domain-containing protein